MGTDDTRRRMEGVVERRIREAVERGEFANLPGAGKPLDQLDETYDPAWWAKRWVRRQRLEAELSDLREELRRLRPKAVVDASVGARLVEIADRMAEVEASLAGDAQ